MKGKELIATGGALFAAIIVATIAYFTSGYWTSLFLNLASTLIGIGVGIALINVYFDVKSRRRAIQPLLQLITPSIAKVHNSLLRRGFDNFGMPQFKEIMDRYHVNNRDPRALSPDERNKLYDIVKSDKNGVLALYDMLESDLRELTIVLGWSFDPQILASAFACRYAITKMRSVVFDDSDQCKLDVCEQFLDVDGAASLVFARLVKVTGQGSEVYTDKI